MDQRRSTSGYVYNLFGGAISWMRKRQFIVSLSITEVEYMAYTHASKELVWLQRLCSSMGLVQWATRIYYDIQSAIFLAKNPTYHSKIKNINVQYHFVRDLVKDKKVLLVKVDTLKNVVDVLMKSVSTEKFSWCRETIGIVGLDHWLSSLMTSCVEKKTTSGGMLGVCCILSTTSHMRRGEIIPSFCCTEHSKGVVAPLYGV